MQVLEKLSLLRQAMQENGIEAYIVHGSDPHASEYMAPHWEEMSWISGFLGETGTAVITLQEALLWTDSRYYIQAEKELQNSSFVLMRASEIDCPTIEQWLSHNLSSAEQIRVGTNAQMFSYNNFCGLHDALAQTNISLIDIDLIRDIWTEDRPSIPQSKLVVYDVTFAGRAVSDKIEQIRTSLREHKADTMIISALDEIGWLLNIRGNDVAYTPCLIAYLVLHFDKCMLFIDPAKIDEKGKNYLADNDIATCPYEDIYAYLRSLTDKKVLFDGNRTNYSLVLAAHQHNSIRNVSPSPVQFAMSKKNAIEVAGTKQAMIKDGVALTRFFMWFDEIVRLAETEQSHVLENLSEIDIAEKLHSFRQQGENFKDESFCTIAAVGENGAIVHYHADEKQCAHLRLNDVLLLDSGGQYLDGTTDITRTVWIGNDMSRIPAHIKHDFTLVLKGHIALANAIFPQGTRGNQLDVLAHQFMWKDGITYTHGTGHGVGHFMGCHEGPQNIRTDNNPNALQCGNICSDEPGIYRQGEYGIRTENLVLVAKEKEKQRSTGETYLHFETLTLCFYDTKLIDRSMLTSEEVQWINQYHNTVFNTLSPYLQEEESQYLSEKCKPL